MIVVDSKKGCKTNRVITGRVKSAKRGLQRSYSAGNSVVIIIFIFGTCLVLAVTVPSRATNLFSETYPPKIVGKLVDAESNKQERLESKSERQTKTEKSGVVRWTAKRRQFTINGVDYGFTGLPVIYYSPSTNWNYGLRLQWADYRRRPYRYKLTVFFQNSTSKRKSYFIKFKVPRISGTGFGLRLIGSVKHDIRARYYGLGNDSEFNKGYVDRDHECNCYIDEDYYHYTLRSPRLLMSLLREIYGPVLLSVGFGLERTDVDSRKQSSINHPPDGVTDGITGFVSAMLKWDTRDDPVIPSTGTFHEWSYESSRNSLLGLLFEQIDFQRWTFTDIRYVPLIDRLNFAHRTVIDVLKGTVPLYAYGEIGGSRRMKGLGGAESLRGFDRQRFTDKVRFITNSEMRYHVRSDRMFKQYLEWHSVIFVDSGQVQPSLKRLDALDLHWSFGFGQRLYWNSDFVIRLDVGFSAEQSYTGFKYRNIF